MQYDPPQGDEWGILRPSFGGHDYVCSAGGRNCVVNSHTKDCAYGCGAWMGGTRSGAPEGIDTFGLCPKNPLGFTTVPLPADVKAPEPFRPVEDVRRTISLDQFLKETFSPEFLKEADFEYLKAQVEGLQNENARLKAEVARKEAHIGIFERALGVWEAEKTRLEAEVTSLMKKRRASDADPARLERAANSLKDFVKLYNDTGDSDDAVRMTVARAVLAAADGKEESVSPCAECGRSGAWVKGVETGDIFCTNCAIAMLRSQVLHLQERRDRLKQACSVRGVALDKAEAELQKARAESAEAFVEWLVGCRQPSGFEVHVTGTEGGHPFDRMVSLTDALTDFRTREV